MHSGTADVKKRWMEDKAIKAGWPIHVVQACSSDSKTLVDWPTFLVKLGKRLLGVQKDDIQPPFDLDQDELQSLGAELQEPGHYTLPSFTAPLTLHIFFDESQQYPRPNFAPMFISSDVIPPYVRLHVLSRVLATLYQSSGLQELGETFGMSLMRVMDGEWAHIEDEGPPDISAVMIHLLPEQPQEIETISVNPKVPEKEARPTNRIPRDLNRRQKLEAKVSH